MARHFSKKDRNRTVRREKPMILIIAEGKNVTESQYFKFFQNQHSAYNIKVLIPGHITDPRGMQNVILRFWDQYEMSAEKGDAAFIVLDLDCSDEKGKLIRKLARENRNAKFIASNPCFEVWFLLHYRYSTHSYHNSGEAVRDLRNFIPDYEKNADVASIMADSLDQALIHAEMLRKYYDSLGVVWPSNECNPRTDVPVIIDVIRGFQ